MASQYAPTTEDLKRAYRDTGLSFLGIDFAHAMDVRAIRTALTCKAKAAHVTAGQHGTPAPIQPGLI